MLEKYIIAAKLNTEKEKIVIIEREDYYNNFFQYEPITAFQSRDKAVETAKHIQTIGIKKYFDEVCERANSLQRSRIGSGTAY
jgi:hypothetical protein